jgi:hypothetical protein
MPVAIAITPASGSVIEKHTACRVDVTGADVNDAASFDPTQYPTEDLITYYLSFERTGSDTGRSQLFQVAADGGFTFNSYIFPDAGSWTVHLRKASDDSSVANLAVTVS